MPSKVWLFFNKNMEVEMANNKGITINPRVIADYKNEIEKLKTENSELKAKIELNEVSDFKTYDDIEELMAKLNETIKTYEVLIKKARKAESKYNEALEKINEENKTYRKKMSAFFNLLK